MTHSRPVDAPHILIEEYAASGLYETEIYYQVVPVKMAMTGIQARSHNRIKYINIRAEQTRKVLIQCCFGFYAADVSIVQPKSDFIEYILKVG